MNRTILSLKRFLPIAALLTLMAVSCTKEGDTTSLLVTVERYQGHGKNYIDEERYACWSDGDQVNINGSTKSVVILNDECHIYDVTLSRNGYTVCFPAGITNSGTVMGSSTITGVHIPSTQPYSTDDQGRQMVQTVMVAHLPTATGTVNFYNACIALKINITNNYSRILRLSSVTVSDNAAPLSGTFDIVGVNTASPALSYAGSSVSDADRSITLPLGDGITLATGNSTVLYIILPPTNDYSQNRFTIHINAHDEEDLQSTQSVTIYEFDHTQAEQEGIGAFPRNTMVPINIRLDEPHTLVLKGIGTTSNPYKIYSANDLKSMQHLVNTGRIPVGNGQPFASAYYELMNNIDLTGQELLPIGTASCNFTGHFNGGGHTLSNLQVAGGLFGFIGQGSTITDLVVENAIIDMSGTPVGGVICAHADHSTINHCRVMGTVEFDNLPNSAAYMGGIVGEASALSKESSHIRNCHCAASITLTGSSVAHRLGGIAGHLHNSLVTNSHTQVFGSSASNASMTIGSAYAGGIAGRCDGLSDITNCYYGIYDNVSCAEGHFGDICGEVGGSTHITYAYYRHTIAVLDNSTEGFIQSVYPYDLSEGLPVYTINGQSLGERLNSVSTTLGTLPWSNPSDITQAPQLINRTTEQHDNKQPNKQM
ncbi:MAG: hypothetical protein IJM33_04670 [Bacteroidales bacterium]|nr:hypothetical protein [Bacteroidales bacterium]